MHIETFIRRWSKKNIMGIIFAKRILSCYRQGQRSTRQVLTRFISLKTIFNSFYCTNTQMQGIIFAKRAWIEESTPAISKGNDIQDKSWQVSPGPPLSHFVINLICSLPLTVWCNFGNPARYKNRRKEILYRHGHFHFTENL